MLLNENKPPLDEVLVHYGVKGMRWGRRKSAGKELDPFEEYDAMERKARNRRRLAVAGLVAVGVVATAVILGKSGHLKMPNISNTPKTAFNTLNNKSKNERQAARDAARTVRDKYKNSNFAKKTFRPDQVGNPLWTVNPDKPKAMRDMYDAGFGKDNVFNVSSMKRGSATVSNFKRDVWETPISHLGGRR